ncbi:hypothetical protein LSAT2_023642 [Lamellibrachia satsuma]|nr:hypothetical protein LSAT2_023642 [Lamellibrachia satsuma]
MASLDSGGPIEFLIPGSGDDYLDLANTMLHVQAKVTRVNGDDLDLAEPMGPVNNWLYSLFSQVDVYLNAFVTPLTNTYAYRAYIKTPLVYGPPPQPPPPTSRAWTKGPPPPRTPPRDTRGRPQPKGFVASKNPPPNRSAPPQNAPPPPDPFPQNKIPYQPPQNQTNNRPPPAPPPPPGWGGPPPLLHPPPPPPPPLFKKATLNPTVQMAQIKALEKSTVKYPMRSVDCKVYSITAGARTNTHENLFLGILSKRLVVCCIDNDVYNGSYDKNPFHDKNNNINFLAMYVDGRYIPSKPLHPNFDDDLFIRSYMNQFSSTGEMWQDEGKGLSRSDFRHGYTFFGFDLTPDACDGACIQLVQKGNLRIEIHFRDALPTTVNVITYAEFESVLEIDKSRNIIYDY